MKMKSRSVEVLVPGIMEETEILLTSSLTRGHVPDLFIDLIRHDILVDPIILHRQGQSIDLMRTNFTNSSTSSHNSEEINHPPQSMSQIYSKESLFHWFAVCEAQKLSLTCPLTGVNVDTPPNYTDYHVLKEKLIKYSKYLSRYRKISLMGCFEDEENHELELNFQYSSTDLLSIHRLTRIFIPIEKIPLQIRDVLPKWEAPQFAVIGEINCGKSSLLERISLTSVFPIGDGHHTCLPIHLKLRHSAHHSPPILRVIDTKKKVFTDSFLFLITRRFN